MPVTSTYFQGGDYVELLSAQGKAPASTWKLQGKILKSFDKAIKGNAFQMDGSSETKMQLPKAPTASSSSLGLTQRFLVFQILVPHTRSFSLEIGFSDFQKIRRRLVFSSAFRETAMTALHVQIPLSNSVPRDQWMNFVFDLQALTDQFFSGSSFRSTESICISGSCRLKRIFTMKDAPYSPTIEARMHNQLAVYRQQRLQVKDMASVPIGVTTFTEMKEIPKQFVFTIGSSSLSIPTEYFETMPENNEEPASSVQARHRKTAAPVPNNGAKLVQKLGSANGTGRQVRGNADKKDRICSAPTRVKPTSGQSSRVLVTSHLASDREEGEGPNLTSGRRPRSVNSDDAFSTTTSPIGSARVSIPPTPTVHSDDDMDLRESSLIVPQNEVELSPTPRTSPPLSVSPTKQEGKSFSSLSQIYEATAALERRTQRRNVISQIQSRLDQLTKEAQEEEERDRELLKKRTPVVTDQDSETMELSEDDTRANKEDISDDLHSNESRQGESTSHGWGSDDHEILRSPEPMVLKRAHVTKKPVISFSSSIFTFGRGASAHISPNENESSAKTSKNLFDWDSLLQDASLKKEPSTRSLAASRSPLPMQLVKSESKFELRDGGCPDDAPDLSCDSDDDAELAALMKAKRQSRRASEEPTTTELTRPAVTQDEALEDVPINGVQMEMESRFEFPTSPLERDVDLDGTSAEDVPSPRSDASLSIDMTDRLEDLGPANRSSDQDIEWEKNSGGIEGEEEEEEESFDFGELVAHTRETRSPPRPSRVSAIESASATASRPVTSLSHDRTPKLSPPRSNDPMMPRVPTTKSPLKRSTGGNLSDSKTTPLASSSQRRLASLLESTDWSQLPLSSMVAFKTRASTRDATEAFSKHEKHSSLSEDRGSANSSIELIYDPILRCYYDPVGKKYYTLAK